MCLLLLAVCMLALAGCGDDGDGTGGGGTGGEATGGGGSGDETGTTEPTSSEIPIRETAPEEVLGQVLAEAQDRQAREQKVLDDSAALAPMLNAFWTNDLRQVHSIEFDPPDRFEYYNTTGNSPCGPFVEPVPQNAYYCTDDATEHVAFDMDWFQGYLDAHPGGATTFLILAHEWGHAVQDSWLENGGNDVWEPAYRQELNADCLAGVFLASSIRDGSIVVEEGDEEAMFSWLYEAGSANWLDPGTHGTREQRQAAFVDGVRQQDSAFCRQKY